MNKVFSVSSCFLVISIANSNNPDSILPHKSTVIYNTTSEYTVITFANITFKDVNIFGLSDIAINISKENLSKEILIKDIHSIKFEVGGFRNGALIGAGSALVLGYITIALADTADEEFKNGSVFFNGLLVGVTFALPLGLLGGLIGIVVPNDHIYKFKKSDLEANKLILNYIFKKYSNR